MAPSRIKTHSKWRSRKITKKTTKRQIRSNTASASNTNQYVVSKRGNNWSWEIAALAVSIFAVSALITLLIYVDGQPLDQWTFFISLNALISILAAVSRASLGFTISSCLAQVKWNWFRRRPDSLIGFDRFDDASRGPWGSLWLIIWLRKPHWVAIGAITTIMLVAFEPFLQVIIAFNGQFQPFQSTEQATIKQCHLLDAGSYEINKTALPVNVQLSPSNKIATLQPFDFRADDGMSSALNSGFFYKLYRPGNLPNPSFICPTTNCTWGVLSTIAMCSECKDVTKYLVAYQENYEDGQGSITYALPFINITNFRSPGALYNESIHMTATRFTDSQFTISFKNLTTMVTAVQVLQAAKDYDGSGKSWTRTAVTATECALYFCVNIFESAVRGGVLRERILGSWHDRDMDSYLPEDPIYRSTSFRSYETWNNHSLYSQYGDFRRDKLRLNISADEQLQYNIQKSSYRLTQNTVGSTSHLINGEILAQSMVWPRDKQSITQMLYERNLTEVFDNTARLISNWMRDSAGTEKIGVEQKWVIRIKVEWSFVVIPALTISLGYMFSVWTMLETRQLKLQPWKTDMIATLAHTADLETGLRLMHANRKGDLRKVARNMKVGLENTKRGFELRIKKS